MDGVGATRRAEAELLLVGRGLLEGLAAGAALGVAVVAAAVVSAVLSGTGGTRWPVAADVGVLAVALAVGTALGLVGAVLALLALGAVARTDRTGWRTSVAAWLVPALVVVAATLGLGAATWVEPFAAAALPAGGLTAWRVRHAVRGHRTGADGTTAPWG